MLVYVDKPHLHSAFVCNPPSFNNYSFLNLSFLVLPKAFRYSTCIAFDLLLIYPDKLWLPCKKVCGSILIFFMHRQFWTFQQTLIPDTYYPFIFLPVSANLTFNHLPSLLKNLPGYTNLFIWFVVVFLPFIYNWKSFILLFLFNYSVVEYNIYLGSHSLLHCTTYLVFAAKHMSS